MLWMNVPGRGFKFGISMYEKCSEYSHLQFYQYKINMFAFMSVFCQWLFFLFLFFSAGYLFAGGGGKQPQTEPWRVRAVA